MFWASPDLQLMPVIMCTTRKHTVHTERPAELASLGQPSDWPPLGQKAGLAAVGVSQNQPPRSLGFHSLRICRVNLITLRVLFLNESTCFFFLLQPLRA